MEAIKQVFVNAANLLKVKTVVTIMVVATFCALTIRGDDISTEFTMLLTAVTTYYFAKSDVGRTYYCEKCGVERIKL